MRKTRFAESSTSLDLQINNPNHSAFDILSPITQNQSHLHLKAPSFTYACIPLFLHCFSKTLLLTAFSQTILTLVCHLVVLSPETDYQTCALNSDVQSQTATWEIIFLLASLLPGIFALPMIGSISDNYGRKVAMSIPAFGAFVNFFSTVVVLECENPLALYFLVLSAFFVGALGDFKMIKAIAYAYVSDIVDNEKLTASYGKLEAMLFVAFTLGPVCGGALIRLTGSLISPFIGSTIISIFELLFIMYVLPESRPPIIHSGPKEDISLDTIKSHFKELFDAFMEFISRKERKSHLFICINNFVFTAGMGSFMFFQLYTALKFGWDSADVGVFFLIVAISGSFYMGVMLPWFIRNSEKLPSILKIKYQLNVVRGAFFVGVISLFLNGLVYQPWQLYVLGFFVGVGILSTPILRGLLSQSTSQDKQGQLFATVAVFELAGDIVSPLIFGNIYRNTVKSFSGATFMVTSLSFFVCFVLTFFVEPGDVVKVKEVDDEGVGSLTFENDD